MRAVYASIKQAILSRGFLLAFAGTALVLLLSSFEGFLAAYRSEQLLPYGYHHTLILGSLSSQPMALALPILCALPYTAAFLDDVKSGFIKAYLPRTTVDGYIMSRALGCAISGGLAISLGILAAYGIAALLLLPLEAMRDYLLDPPGYFSPAFGNAPHVLRLRGLLGAGGPHLRHPHQQPVYGLRLPLRPLLPAGDPI